MSQVGNKLQSSDAPAHGAGFDVERVRRDFPILHQQVHGRPLVYLDNGATTQKPQSVIDAVSRFYAEDNANVHRGVHELSMRASEAYDGVRSKVAQFINAAHDEEIVFLRGTTEAINLVAQTWGRASLAAGDEVLITEMEHHSNIVPWQMLAEQTGAVLKVVPINDAGELVMEEFHGLLGPRTRLVSVAHVSNALGTINPIGEIIQAAHAQGALVLVDGAQAAAHMSVDVQALGCDFYAFSGHKLYGPTGIGVLYGRLDLLKGMPPWHGGGDMIRKVSFEETLYAEPPFRFEAGTPNIAGTVGLGAAIDYLLALGLDEVAAYEHELLAYANEAIARELPDLRIIGTAREKTSILSFQLPDVHAHDVGTIMDNQGIAIRAGHHCAMPVMQHFRVPATARASFGLYNTRAEVDVLVEGIRKVREVFQR